MKKIFSILCAIIFSLGLSAQTQFGLEAGLNMSNITGSDWKDAFGHSTKMRPGIRIGPTAAFELSDEVTLKTGLIYSVKGWESSMDIITTDIFGFILSTEEVDYSQSINYLEIPTNFSFSVSDQLFLMAGPYFGILLGGTTYVGDDSESTDMDGFRTIDTGLNLGAGFAATESLNINLGYQLGLTSIDEDGDLDAKIQQFILE